MNALKPSLQRIDLRGVEGYWSHQSEPNDCWAAALDIGLRFLKVQNVSESLLLRTASRVCPALENQPAGADAYQISYIRQAAQGGSGRAQLAQNFCDTAECVVASLQRGRPLVMLGKNHAVLLVGASFIKDSTVGINNNRFQIEAIRVLDPAGNGRVEERGFLEFCQADVFMVL